MFLFIYMYMYVYTWVWTYICIYYLHSVHKPGPVYCLCLHHTHDIFVLDSLTNVLFWCRNKTGVVQSVQESEEGDSEQEEMHQTCLGWSQHDLVAQSYACLCKTRIITQTSLTKNLRRTDSLTVTEVDLCVWAGWRSRFAVWGGASCSLVANLDQNPTIRPIVGAWLPALLKQGTMMMVHLYGPDIEERWMLGSVAGTSLSFQICDLGSGTGTGDS